MVLFKSYAAGAGLTSDPAHLSPFAAVDVSWVMNFGSRSQRRRVERELYRQPKKPEKAKKRKAKK